MEQKDNRLTFQFISEPSDVNFGGKVHGGVVMKWIDQAAYACASNWSETYAVTVYVGGIRFYRPIKIGSIVKVEARIIYTGTSSMHIAVDVLSKELHGADFTKTTHCIIVFAAVDESGQTTPIPKWIPTSSEDKKLETYARRLMDLRKNIEDEMNPFL